MPRPTLIVADENGGKSSKGSDGLMVGSLSSLVATIISQHHEYLKRELPAIEVKLTDTAQANSRFSETATTILPIFVRFRRELESHMRREEMVLFPLIECLVRAAGAGQPPPHNSFGPLSNAIQFMNEDHEFENTLMIKIADITGGFSPHAAGDAGYTDLMSRLHALKLDLDAHILKEDGTLFPEAIRLEESLNQ